MATDYTSPRNIIDLSGLVVLPSQHRDKKEGRATIHLAKYFNIDVVLKEMDNEAALQREARFH